MTEYQLDILKETAHWLVINKPTGLNVEKLASFPSVETLAQAYLALEQRKNTITGIVHRLDRAVSGLLLIAKKKSALTALNAQFAAGTTQKIYLAIVQGIPNEASLELQHHLEKDHAAKMARIHSKASNNTKPVRLHYDVIGQKEGCALLKVHLYTGRFHQIRAQLAAVGLPIVGDSKYGASAAWPTTEGIALHAWQLHFHDPLTGNPVCVTASPELLPGWEQWKNEIHAVTFST